MYASPGMGYGRGVDGRPQERVGEPEPTADSLQDARRGHDEEPIGSTRRQCREPCREQLLEISRNRERFARRRPNPLPGEGPSDLKREQRVTSKDPVQPQQERRPPPQRTNERTRDKDKDKDENGHR